MTQAVPQNLFDGISWISLTQYGITASAGQGEGDEPGEGQQQDQGEGQSEGQGEGSQGQGEGQGTGEGEGQDTSAGAQAGAEEQQDKTPPKPDWREKQLAKARAQGKAKDEEIARLKAALEPFQRNQQPVDQRPSQAEIDRQVEERAAALVSQKQFENDIKALAEAGKSTFADWDSQMTQLGGMVDANDPQAVLSYSNLVSASMKTGNGPQVLYALSRDPNEAARIMELPAVDMGIELAKLALKPAPEVSAAARPIRPVAGAAASRSEIRPDDTERADSLSIEEWMRRRSATAWDAPQDRRRA